MTFAAACRSSDGERAPANAVIDDRWRVTGGVNRVTGGAAVGQPATAADLAGTWELVFSSAAAKIPLLDGYMPNRELLTWDLKAARLELEIETLPMLPKVRVVGESLAWDEATQTLTYTVGSKPTSEWKLLFFDASDGVIAARSSVTGLNLIRRLRGGTMAPAARPHGRPRHMGMQLRPVRP